MATTEAEDWLYACNLTQALGEDAGPEILAQMKKLLAARDYDRARQWIEIVAKIQALHQGSEGAAIH